MPFGHRLNVRRQLVNGRRLVTGGKEIGNDFEGLIGERGRGMHE